MFGLILLVGIPIEFITGLLSYAAYDPKLGNAPASAKGLFGLYVFNWVTKPSWLYRVIEGTHVFLGLVLVPVVLAKLWSVMPKLFDWPPWRSVAQLLERLSLVLVVGGIVFEMATGLLNINYFNQINFYSGHFYGAWAFIAGFVLHVCVKFGDMVRALRSRSFSGELRTGLAATRPEEVDSPLVATRPAAPTISRRGVLALVGGTSLAVFVLTAGEAIGGACAQGGPVRHPLPLARLGGEPLPGQPHGRVGRDHRRRRRAGLAPVPGGRAPRRAQPGPAVGHGADHGRPAHRLHRGMVDPTALDRRAPRRSGPPGRNGTTGNDPDHLTRRRIDRPVRIAGGRRPTRCWPFG